MESEPPIAASGAGAAPQMTRQGDVRIVEEAWGYDHQKDETAGGYRRDFSWDSENRLKEVKSGTKITRFLYDAAGERTGKIGERGETLYFNAWFTSREDGALYRNSKHIFVGSHRAVTRLNADTGGTWEAEDLTTYYYHPDHLGSVSVVSDRRGDPYERIEYTPYGEMWQEVRHDGNTAASKYIPYRFTAKEWDEETGLYYHGARYYEPRLSRWISADPAGFSLSRPMNARGEPRRSYSIVEAANWYSYVSNNPVKYVDPTGLFEVSYDEDGNATIQAEIENRNDITDAVSTFYSIVESLSEGEHNIQFIDREGNISGDYSTYSDALGRLLQEWPDEILLSIGLGAEFANVGVFAGFGQRGPEASVSYLLASATAYGDSEGNVKVGADVGFTLIAIPGVKIDFSFVNYTKNYYHESFYKIFGNKKSKQ